MKTEKLGKNQKVVLNFLKLHNGVTNTYSFMELVDYSIVKDFSGISRALDSLLRRGYVKTIYKLGDSWYERTKDGVKEIEKPSFVEGNRRRVFWVLINEKEKELDMFN